MPAASASASATNTYVLRMFATKAASPNQQQGHATGE